MAEEQEQSGEVLSPPYVHKAGQKGNVTIWVVDGIYVRTHLDPEFTNFGHHLVFDCIPENEFWLDQQASNDEEKFYIEHMLVEHRLMSQGVPYEKAREAGNRKELDERKRAGDIRQLTEGSVLPDPQKVHVRLWKQLESGVSVWIVDGRLVRSGFNVDFTEGGHDYVYEFVPHDEVWIDNDLAQEERPYVLFHELHERNLMAQGWTYTNAHEESSSLEYYYRRHPEELHMALSKEGWEGD
jgi:hypothetical protein